MMPYRVFLFALLSFTLGSCMLPSASFVYSPISADSLKKEADVDLDMYEAKYGEHPGVFLAIERTFDHLFGNPANWNYFETRRQRFLILNPDAEWLTTLVVRETDEMKVNDVYVNIVYPDGTAKGFSKADMNGQVSPNGNVTYKFAYPGIVKGTLIEEGYQLENRLQRPPLNIDVPLQHSIPVEKIAVRYAFPINWNINIKQVSAGKRLLVETKVDRDNYKKVVEHISDNVPARADEIYSPFAKELPTYMELSVGSIPPYMTETTWVQVAEGLKSYAIDKDSFWGDEVGDVVEEATKGMTDDYLKLDTIISYIQNNIKVGEGEYDDDFGDILDRGEGRLHMVNGMAQVMLQKAGILSEYLFIHSAEDGFFDETFVAPGQLYIPAIMATIGTKEYVVFPYIKNFPIDYIPEYYQGEKALQIDENGYVGFTSIPEGTINDNTVQENYVLSIDEDGVIHVVEEKTYRGVDAYSTREQLNDEDLKESELEDGLKAFLTYTDGEVKLDKYEFENRYDYKNSLVIKLYYTIDNLVTVTPDEVIFQTGGLFSPSSSNSRKVDVEERQNPIKIRYNERYIKNITINYPREWSLATELGDVEYKNQFGEIEGFYTVSPGQIKVAQTRSLYKASEPAEKFGELLKVVGKKSRLYIPTIIFKNNGSE